ncbi:MAG: squalene/phytoene synthase family protein [bacterium]
MTELPLQLAGRSGRLFSNLAPALMLLPAERRKNAYLFFDYCRTVDDIADNGEMTPEARVSALDSWIEALGTDGEHLLPRDFLAMIERCRINRNFLKEIILGMKMDTGITRYATFEELRHYCWRVASAVGLVSASLFGAKGEIVERYAERLGIALQLTNILRDIAEDAAMNRIYLPREDLDRFGVSEEQILSCISSPETTHLFSHHAERADAFFASAELAWTEMSANQRHLMRPARLMSAIYRGLLLQMHRDRYDVLHRKYRVGVWFKIHSFLTILLHPYL